MNEKDNDLNCFIGNLLGEDKIEGELSMIDKSFENDQNGDWECPVHLGPWIGWIKKYAWQTEENLYKFRVCVPCSNRIISKRKVSIIDYKKEISKIKPKAPKKSLRDIKKQRRSNQYAVPSHAEKTPTNRIRRTTLEPLMISKLARDRVLHAYGLHRDEAIVIANLAQLNLSVLPDYMKNYYRSDNDTNFNQWLLSNRFVTKGQSKQIVKTFFMLREKGIIDFDDKGVLMIK